MRSDISERELLEIIGAAVKRKKKQHAGGELFFLTKSCSHKTDLLGRFLIAKSSEISCQTTSHSLKN